MEENRRPQVTLLHDDAGNITGYRIIKEVDINPDTIDDILNNRI